MTTPLQTYLSEIRARVENAQLTVERLFQYRALGSESESQMALELLHARTDIPRLLRIVERAVEALKNAELSFMGMGNATIDHGLPPTAQELINMCEDRAKRMQGFLADIDAMARGEECVCHETSTRNCLVHQNSGEK